MRPRGTKNVLASTTAAAAAVLLLSGCGAGTTPTGSAGAAATTAGSSAPAASPLASANGSGAPAPASPSVSSAAASSESAAQAGVPLCKAAELTAGTEVTGAAAGSVYLEVVLTNSGSGSCMLHGFPGVSLTADADGEPIGAPAARDESGPVIDVMLAPGQAGGATLRYTQAANYQECTRTKAAGLRVYPPEDTASLFVADPRDACRNPDINLLTIGAFQAR